MTKWFSTCRTIDDAKKLFRSLAKQYHPDITGEDTTAIMQQINAEFDEICRILQSGAETATQTNAAADYRNIVVELLKIRDITIELVGSWIWISGNTKQNKDALKALGARWSSGKKAWYIKPNTCVGYRRGTGGNLQHLRDKYGCMRYKAQENDII